MCIAVVPDWSEQNSQKHEIVNTKSSSTPSLTIQYMSAVPDILCVSCTVKTYYMSDVTDMLNVHCPAMFEIKNMYFLSY